MIGDDDDVAIAAVTVAELLVGVQMADTKRRRAARDAFVHDVLEAVPVISYDEEIARAHADFWSRCAEPVDLAVHTISSSRLPLAQRVERS